MVQGSHRKGRNPEQAAIGLAFRSQWPSDEKASYGKAMQLEFYADLTAGETPPQTAGWR